jgi:formylglycine-generating enzyme required for sulfatase activity
MRELRTFEVWLGVAILLGTAACGSSSSGTTAGADATPSDSSPGDTGSEVDSTMGAPDAPADSVGLADVDAGPADAPGADALADSPADAGYDQTAADAADASPADAAPNDGAGEAGDGCVSGSPCAPANRCHAGTLNCSTGVCTDTGSVLVDGASCAGGWTCTSGVCLPPTNPLSCAPGGPGMTNCGSATESCCTSPEVDGGTFYRAFTNTVDAGIDGEADPATVSSLRVDKYLVTVGRFRQFVEAVLPPDGGTGWLPPAGAGKHTYANGDAGLANSAFPGTREQGWQASDDSNIAPSASNLACYVDATWTITAGNHENLPITCANWYEAYAFCIWDGGFLPTEAEWGYVAAGGTQQREYPWGSTPPGTASQYAIFNCYYPDGDAGLFSCQSPAHMAPVGTPSAGAALWGQIDMAGEVREWTLDFINSYQSPCVDCAFISTGGYHVCRGGDYQNPASSFGDRDSFSPSQRTGYIGFRCARGP